MPSTVQNLATVFFQSKEQTTVFIPINYCLGTSFHVNGADIKVMVTKPRPAIDASAGERTASS